MSENQLMRLSRTFWVSSVNVMAVVVFMLTTALDIVVWQSWYSSWATSDNFMPLMIGLTIYSLPFWALAILAERKMEQLTKENS